MISPNLKAAGDSHRTAAAERSRQRSQDAADIGPPPEVVDPERKERCRYNLLDFLVTYFPNSTGLKPFSEDHIRAIKSIELAILKGGRYINAVYRGFAKTTISENAAIWATLYGHRRFVGIVGATGEAADENIEAIQTELANNEMLFDDFPEVCHPIVALDNKLQRCKTQTIGKDLTYIKWNAGKIVFPTVIINGKTTAASGAIIMGCGLTGRVRGMKHKRKDGVNQRPDFVIIDDAQTDETAASADQCAKRIKLITRAILKSAGHTKTMSAVINATVLECDDVIDQLLDHDKHPEWEGLRVSMVKKWAKRHDDYWLDDYKRIRTTYDPSIPGDRARAAADATAFYKRRRKLMDEGCEISWEHCFDPECEISAIQHAYNILIDDGEDAFAAECQNNPNRADDTALDLMPLVTLASLMNDFERCLVPPNCRTITMGIDVHKRLLYYTILAISDSFDVYIIDYGTWPEQKRRSFLLRTAKPTIQKTYPGLGEEEQIKSAVRDLLNLQMGRTFLNKSGEAYQIKMALVDGAWGEYSAEVREGINLSKYVTRVYPAFGKGIGANENPLLSYASKEGEFRPADNTIPWRILPSKSIGERHVQWDTNTVKSFVHNRLKTPRGAHGSMSFFKADRPHTLYAEHLLAEDCRLIEGKKRKAHEWKLPTSKPDNHWFDTTNMAITAGSMCGLSILNKPKSTPKQNRRQARAKRKRVTQA
ncbi:terminase gpA endonuclease subunit [Paremcibacter congregatus]|uniref:terminase gpA endonuclease subunit n=1 Tax=Paremcibacter congregatus TaxID=2043170 RepID=UPI003A945B4C